MAEYLTKKGRRALDKALEDVMEGGLYELKDGKYVKASKKDKDKIRKDYLLNDSIRRVL